MSFRQEDALSLLTYTFKPGESSLVYSLIIVEEEPPAPAALVDMGFSVPSFKAAARRLYHNEEAQGARMCQQSASLYTVY